MDLYNRRDIEEKMNGYLLTTCGIEQNVVDAILFKKGQEAGTSVLSVQDSYAAIVYCARSISIKDVLETQDLLDKVVSKEIARLFERQARLASKAKEKL